MDWSITIGDSCLRTLGWLTGLAVAFAILVAFMPCNRGMYWWRDSRAAGADLLYWFVVPLVTRLGRAFMLAAAVALLFGAESPASFFQEAPLWQQCLAILLIQDVLLYWIHRLFHTRLAWSFHAVHHSPKVLDWMSASRFHIVNNLLAFALADVVVLLLGFSPLALFALAPFNTIYSSMVHANLNWTFGPLRYVFASPVFHRWHHTAEGAGIDKNFAPTFPVLDLLFGTFYMPTDERPCVFGNGDPGFPDDFWGQFLHPFRLRSRRIDALIGVGLFGLAACGIVVGRAAHERDLLCSRGETFYNNQEYEQAVAAYSDALRLDSRWANAYANRASAYFNLGDVDLALADFDKALTFDPRLALAYWRRGLVHASLGDMKRAQNDHDKALELDPRLAK